MLWSMQLALRASPGRVFSAGRPRARPAQGRGARSDQTATSRWVLQAAAALARAKTAQSVAYLVTTTRASVSWLS